MPSESDVNDSLERLRIHDRTGSTEPIVVEYCDQCTLPTEYCEFSECAKRIAASKEGADGDHKRQTRGGKAQGTKTKKTAVEKKMQVFRSNRGKKKFVTVVVGMGTFGIDLKEASKFFSKKFACSSSVTGPDEIVVQGDVKDELIDILSEKFPEIDADLVEDGGDQKR
ncbi:Density-regulated protein-like protein, partial [Fragariocoptes setiger]